MSTTTIPTEDRIRALAIFNDSFIEKFEPQGDNVFKDITNNNHYVVLHWTEGDPSNETGEICGDYHIYKTDQGTRIKALAIHLNSPIEELDVEMEVGTGHRNVFITGGNRYFVLTEAEDKENWEDYVEMCLEGILFDIHEKNRKYFDSEAYRRDNLSDRPDHEPDGRCNGYLISKS